MGLSTSQEQEEPSMAFPVHWAETVTSTINLSCTLFAEVRLIFWVFLINISYRIVIVTIKKVRENLLFLQKK